MQQTVANWYQQCRGLDCCADYQFQGPVHACLPATPSVSLAGQRSALDLHSSAAHCCLHVQAAKVLLLAEVLHLCSKAAHLATECFWWVRWVVFDSPAEEPFRFGNVSWARNGGCQCSCADMAACASEGRAPAWGMGLVAQHTCREQVDRVPVWHQVRGVPSLHKPNVFIPQ